MAELMDHVKVLADQIGPRPVSTEEEHQSSLYVAQELTDDGLDVTVDEFATPTGTRWPYVIAYALAILGTIISGVGIFVPGIAASMYLVGLIFLGVAFFIYYSEFSNKPFLSTRRASGISQNVVAKYVPSSVAREQRRRKVVIVAHVDTVRAQPEAMPAVAKHLPLLKRIIYYVMIALLVIEVVRLLPLPWPDTVDFALWIISIIGCVYLLLAVGCIVASRFMPYLSGANDNASAIAVLLAVAKRLLDPEERERYAVERPVEQQADIPVETLVSSTDQMPVVHDAETAYAAGVVPEGAEVEYAAGGNAAPTQVMNPVDFQQAATGMPQQVPFATPGAPVQQGGVAPFAAETTVIPGAVQQQGPAAAPYAQGAQQVPGQVPAQQVPGQPQGYQPLPADLFAASPDQAVNGGVPAQQQAPGQETPAVAVTLPENGEVPAGGFWPQAGGEAETVTVGDVMPGPSAEPVYEPAYEPETEPEPAPAPEPKDNIPSWYKTAKKRAAEDLAGRKDSEKDVDASSYRSRFAEIPVTGRMGAEPEPEPEPEPKPEPQAQPAPKPAVQAAAPANTSEPDQMPGRMPSSKVDEVLAQPVPTPTAPVEAPVEAVQQPIQQQPVLAEPVQQPEPVQQQLEPVQQTVELDFDEEEFDELTPDLSGMFEPVGEQTSAARTTHVPLVTPASIPSLDKDSARTVPGTEVAEQSTPVAAPEPEEPEPGQSGILRGLTSRIPLIGGSNSAADSEEGSAQAASRPKPKIDRRKPTARHLTQEFQPTKATNERENRALDSMRQQAAVSSTYEDTPQAGPEYEHAAAREEQLGATQVINPGVSGSFPSLSGQMPAIGVDPLASPGNSSSFPALTGSFPAISGAIPTIDASDFGEDDYGYGPTADDVADDFAAPAMTSQINIPESRFHSALDKASGLFKHKDKEGGRKGKGKGKKRRGRKQDAGLEADSQLGSTNVDNWDEDDDFGWKGGGYLDENESAFEAAKARAAEIRDSVIQMTENDLLDKEVWFVALGASSANAQGMKNLLELHGSELRGSLIINLEGVGAGEVCYVDYEGTGKPHRSDRRLQSLVKKASTDLDGAEMRAQKLEWRNTDATPAMLSGMRAISIMGFDGEMPANWHWTTDTIDAIDPNNLEYTTKLLLKMIENS